MTSSDGGWDVAETESRLVGRFANALAARAGQGSLIERLCGASVELLHAEGAAVTLATTRQLIREVVIARFEPGAADRWPLLLDQRPVADFTGTIIATPLLGDQTLVGVLSIDRAADELPSHRHLPGAHGGRGDAA